MSDEARILMAQHAKTSELLGVDFLPLGTAPEGLVNAPVEQLVEQSAHQSAPRARQPAKQAPVRPDQPSFAAREPEGQRVGRSVVPSDVAPISADEIRKAYESFETKQARLDGLCAKYELDAPHQHFNMPFNSIVFGEGDPDASLMFIGDAPGEDEDLSGRPFVGRAGQLLENMIKAMGQSRESVYICNVLKTCAPGHATPTADVTAICVPYLFEQIRVVSPKVIVTLGLCASQLLLGETKPMRSMRGHWHPLRADLTESGIPDVQIMPTYHPGYLLRSYTEDNRRKVWSDLTQVIEKLKG